MVHTAHGRADGYRRRISGGKRRLRTEDEREQEAEKGRKDGLSHHIAAADAPDAAGSCDCFKRNDVQRRLFTAEQKRTLYPQPAGRQPRQLLAERHDRPLVGYRKARPDHQSGSRKALRGRDAFHGSAGEQLHGSIQAHQRGRGGDHQNAVQRQGDRRLYHL